MFLGIFTGIEVLFFCLGVLSTLTIGGLVWLRVNRQVAWHSLAVLCVGIFAAIAGIAWSVSSVLEGEPQAGSMGMMVIFLPGIIIASVGARMARQS